MALEIRAFQIHYDAQTRDSLDPDFEPLDELPLSPYFSGLRAEVIRLDALKIELARTGDPALLRQCRALQARTLAAAQRALAQR